MTTGQQYRHRRTGRQIRVTGISRSGPGKYSARRFACKYLDTGRVVDLKASQLVAFYTKVAHAGVPAATVAESKAPADRVKYPQEK